MLDLFYAFQNSGDKQVRFVNKMCQQTNPETNGFKIFLTQICQLSFSKKSKLECNFSHNILALRHVTPILAQISFYFKEKGLNLKFDLNEKLNFCAECAKTLMHRCFPTSRDR